MKTETKIYIGLGITVLVVWAFTTKNEVVESIVFPIKVKLGLAKYKTDGIAARPATIKQAADEITQQLMLSNYPEVIGIGVVGKPTEEYIEIATLNGKDASRVKNMFPSNEYKGFPIKFVSREMAVAQAGTEKLPSIFRATIYRMPTAQELEEVNKYNLSADDIAQGFSYTMIGRGVKSQQNSKQIVDSITQLSKMYPDNSAYKQALTKV